MTGSPLRRQVADLPDTGPDGRQAARAADPTSGQNRFGRSAADTERSISVKPAASAPTCLFQIQKTFNGRGGNRLRIHVSLNQRVVDAATRGCGKQDVFA